MVAAPVKVGTAETVLAGGEIGVLVAELLELPLVAPVVDVEAP